MTKDYVLTILKSEKGYISGEKISAALGVSRAAINAAVKSLRREGYDILSTTNKGYFLNNAPDNLNRGELASLISPQRMEGILCLDTVVSTNQRIREMALDGAQDGQIVIANHQTDGRGRLGRSFLSPKDKGIYLSILLRPEGTQIPAESTGLTAWVAVAVSNAIHTVCGIRPGIKWVNDLILNRKKICGILTEMTIESESGHIQYVIVGIGVNVKENLSDFSEEIQHIATSLFIETGRAYPRARLAAEIIKELDRIRVKWPQERKAYLKAYRSDSVTLGKEIRIQTGNTERFGIATTINDDFSLSVKYEDGQIARLSSGEISVRGLYGYV